MECTDQYFLHTYDFIATHMHTLLHVLMRDEKEGKQDQTNNKQGKATQHTHGSHFS